jgi:channel protein (hemolysin III family)
MFSMSSVYHLLPHGSTSRGVMLRMDHAGIFVLIASTVTVLHTVLFRGVWRWGPIAFFWLVVASMVPLKAIFLHSLSDWVNTGVYIGLGIPGFIALAVLVRRLGWRTCAPLLVGGLSYIVGALFNQLFWPNLIPGVMHAHELFHLFVIGGVACHWRFTWLILAEPLPGGEAPIRSEPAMAAAAR